MVIECYKIPKTKIYVIGNFLRNLVSHVKYNNNNNVN